MAASSSSAIASSDTMEASSDAMEVPPLPPKMRSKPQRRGKHGSNIGEGKLYADEEAFKADADKWDLEHGDRLELVRQRERAQERQRERKRDRSGRQRDGDTETDSQRRVRQQQEHDGKHKQERDELDARCIRARERGIASGELVPIQRSRLKFQNDMERDDYDMKCPLGCPRSNSVFMDMQLHRHMAHSNGEPGELRVKVMLYRRCDVRVQGKVLGYAVYGNPVRRIDTCPCSGCDTVRRTEVWSMQAHGPRSWSQFGDA